jgi:hypothetical protein
LAAILEKINDRALALETIERGGGILDLASDSIYQHLKRNLAEFKGEVIPSSDEYLSAGGSESIVFENVRIARLERTTSIR